jgi:hypothetical protein
MQPQRARKSRARARVIRKAQLIIARRAQEYVRIKVLNAARQSKRHFGGGFPIAPPRRILITLIFLIRIFSHTHQHPPSHTHTQCLLGYGSWPDLRAAPELWVLRLARPGAAH